MTAYTPEQLRRLQQGYRCDEPVAAIARALALLGPARSPASIRVKAHKLRAAGALGGTNRHRGGRRYGDDEIARIVAGVGARRTLVSIAAEVGRSYPSLTCKVGELRDLGLVAGPAR